MFLHQKKKFKFHFPQVFWISHLSLHCFLTPNYCMNEISSSVLSLTRGYFIASTRNSSISSWWNIVCWKFLQDSFSNIRCFLLSILYEDISKSGMHAAFYVTLFFHNYWDSHVFFFFSLQRIQGILLMYFVLSSYLSPPGHPPRGRHAVVFQHVVGFSNVTHLWDHCFFVCGFVFWTLSVSGFRARVAATCYKTRSSCLVPGNSCSSRAEALGCQTAWAVLFPLPF